jgi:hypothetical protein
MLRQNIDLDRFQGELPKKNAMFLREVEKIPKFSPMLRN